MQTFLPYPDFKKSADVLDYRRLGKQRVEAKEILDILRGKDSSWKNHPAVKMWIGYEDALILYMNTMIEEWKARGYNNTMEILDCKEDPEMPLWIGKDEFHISHQSNLVRKYPEYYEVFFPGVSPDIPYYWPSHHV